MIGFREYLIESKMAHLYHATASSYALAIISEKNIDARTGQLNWKLLKAPRKDPKGYRDKTGVSLTRNFEFAKKWAGVIFEIDQHRIQQKYEIIPINYWNDGSDMARSRTKSTEFEEFVVTNKGIPLSYVTTIFVPTKMWNDWSDETHQKFKDTGIPTKVYEKNQVIKSLKR